MDVEYFDKMRIDFFHEIKNYAIKKANLSDDEKLAYIQHLAGIVNNYGFVLYEDLKDSPQIFNGRKELEKLLGTIRFFASRVGSFSIRANHSLIDKIGVEFVEVSSQLQ